MDAREPFHKAIERRLVPLQTREKTELLGERRVGEIVALLGLLTETSDISAEDAHELARKLAFLPELLGSTNHPYLRDFAKRTLDDLQSRVDGTMRDNDPGDEDSFMMPRRVGLSLSGLEEFSQ